MRVKPDEPFAIRHQLAGHDQHLLDAPADFRLDGRAQFRTHRADDIFRGGARLALNRLDANRGGQVVPFDFGPGLYGSRRKTESPRRGLKAEGVSWGCAVSGTARTARFVFVTAARAADAEPFQYDFQRAEIGERRLQQVEPTNAVSQSQSGLR